MGVPYSVAGCRHLLTAVEDLHKLGLQLVRVVPHLADSAGGGRWWCWLVPAELTAPSHGARFASSAPPSRRLGYPFFPGDAHWRSIDFPASPSETAARILEMYPQLAERGRGSDGPYVRWYSEMLRLTAPDGLIISSAYHDGGQQTGLDEMRVVGGRRAVETVHLPPARIG
jgi:hypothetical protein